MSAPLPLPEGSVLVHIGPQKTGSTAIQLAMHESRDALAAHGVHYAGAGQTPREAGWAVLGRSPLGRPAPRDEAWQRLVDELDGATEPRVVVSNEDFALVDDAGAARIVEGTRPDRTHVVLVARRLDKLLPSHWQERVKARMTLSYEDFLAHVTREGVDDFETDLLWSPHDLAPLVDRWARSVDRDRIWVVIADEDDRGVIPRAFEDLLALPTGTLVPPETKSNSSLSYPATEALRRVNQLSRDEAWPSNEYWRIVQAGVVPRLKQRTDDDQPRLNGIPAEFFDLVADRGDRQIEALLSAGVRIIGDTEHLRIRGRVTPVQAPAPVETVPLDLLADIVSGARAGSEKLRAAARDKAARQVQRAARRDPSGRELVGLLARRTRRRIGRTAGPR
jgi:hypothetical protein